MNRRFFIQTVGVGAGSCALNLDLFAARAERTLRGARELKADLVLAGGGLGGCGAALAALRNGLTVIMTEETDWIGGQLTSQGVPPDEHRWIESFGCTRSYRQLREKIRDYYRRNYPLTETARKNPQLNPGGGSVSRLCHEPRVALAALLEMLDPYLSSGQLVLLTGARCNDAEVEQSEVRAIRIDWNGRTLILRAPFFIDATELGDLLPLTKTEFVTGAEAKSQTGELHALEKADPRNEQSFTVCFAMDHLPGQNHVIERPREYLFWRDFIPPLTPPWPGKLLSFTYTHPSSGQPRTLGFNPEGPTPGAPVNLWVYRRIVHKTNFQPGAFQSDISLVNWPQNDYMLGNLTGSIRDAARHIDRAKQLSLSWLYWLQTEAPRPDGGTGFPGLRLRGDIFGTADGLARYPYVRESRRIKALFTVHEEHVGTEMRRQITGKTGRDLRAAQFTDTVGVGSYAIDLHPSTKGNNYIDFASLPFQIPLGALIPVRVQNLLAGCKNLGVTHITNGCYRLHPVEWNIGEAAGALAAFAIRKKTLPRHVRESPELLRDFQASLRQQGFELEWPGETYQ